MDPIQETLQRHGEQIESLHRWKGAVDEALIELRESDNRLLEMVGRAATKDDIGDLRTHVDEAVNGILRDALNAVPAHAQLELTRTQIRISRWHVLLVASSVVVAVAALAFSYWARGGHF